MKIKFSNCYLILISVQTIFKDANEFVLVCNQAISRVFNLLLPLVAPDRHS